jgi:hypothetical protein
MIYRDVYVQNLNQNGTFNQNKETIVRIEGDNGTTEISDIVAMRLAANHIWQDRFNDAVIAKHCRIAPAPTIILGMDGVKRWYSKG